MVKSNGALVPIAPLSDSYTVFSNIVSGVICPSVNEPSEPSGAFMSGIKPNSPGIVVVVVVVVVALGPARSQVSFGLFGRSSKPYSLFLIILSVVDDGFSNSYGETSLSALPILA